MWSIRFIVTIVEFVSAIIFYLFFLRTSQPEYAMGSMMNILLISISTLAILINGSNWMFCY